MAEADAEAGAPERGPVATAAFGAVRVQVCRKGAAITTGKKRASSASLSRSFWRLATVARGACGAGDATRAREPQRGLGRGGGGGRRELSPGAEHVLLDYPWPGNVRELRNVLERPAALGEQRHEVEQEQERAQGRESLNVTSDIGAMDPGSWHDWHLAWKIGATSLENVGPPFALCCAITGAASSLAIPASKSQRLPESFCRAAK